jgi:hypothetical protein
MGAMRERVGRDLTIEPASDACWGLSEMGRR